MALDRETEERIEQPVSEQAERETRLTPPKPSTTCASAPPSARTRSSGRCSSGQRRQDPEGLVARRERERDRAHGDQRSLVGAHPDRHEHRPQAAPPADQARRRALGRPRLWDDERRRGDRRRAWRADARRRHVDPPRRPRGVQPLPRRTGDPSPARRDLRGARPDRDHLRGAPGDHLPPRRRGAVLARGRDRPRRRRTRHGPGPLADPVEKGRVSMHSLSAAAVDEVEIKTARRSRFGSRS